MSGNKSGALLKPKAKHPKVSRKATSKMQVSVPDGVENEDDETGPRPWLMDLVYAKAAADRLNISELTEKLGYSQGYLFHLKARPYKCSKLGIEPVRKLAEFLGVDAVTVMVAAGILRPGDLFAPEDSAHFKSELVRTVRYIADDKDFSPFIPRPIESLDDQILMLIVYSYQRATGRNLMNVEAPSKRISEMQAERSRRAQRN